MTLALVLATGMLLAGGVVALVVAMMPMNPHLADTLEGLADHGPTLTPRDRAVAGPTGSRADRLGAWLYRASPLPLSARQRQNLQIRNKAVTEFYAEKAVMALVGAICPGLVATAWWLVGDWPPAMPAALAVAGAVVGYFVPDLMLRGTAKTLRSDAGEALLMFIDLVTLERLSNASATQALHHAANLSDTALFAQIRAALERARLEQQSPYAELRRLADQLDLPELRDVADVMQLDETGAALSGSLRARVRELRDAHFTTAQTEAGEVSEQMTIFMTIPALIFGLIFMAPPLMRLALG